MADSKKAVSTSVTDDDAVVSAAEHHRQELEALRNRVMLAKTEINTFLAELSTEQRPNYEPTVETGTAGIQENDVSKMLVLDADMSAEPEKETARIQERGVAKTLIVSDTESDMLTKPEEETEAAEMQAHDAETMLTTDTEKDVLNMPAEKTESEAQEHDVAKMLVVSDTELDTLFEPTKEAENGIQKHDGAARMLASVTESDALIKPTEDTATAEIRYRSDTERDTLITPTEERENELQEHDVAKVASNTEHDTLFKPGRQAENGIQEHDGVATEIDALFKPIGETGAAEIHQHDVAKMLVLSDTKRDTLFKPAEEAESGIQEHDGVATESDASFKPTEETATAKIQEHDVAKTLVSDTDMLTKSTEKRENELQDYGAKELLVSDTKHDRLFKLAEGAENGIQECNDVAKISATDTENNMPTKPAKDIETSETQEREHNAATASVSDIESDALITATREAETAEIHEHDVAKMSVSDTENDALSKPAEETATTAMGDEHDIAKTLTSDIEDDVLHKTEDDRETKALEESVAVMLKPAIESDTLTQLAEEIGTAEIQDDVTHMLTSDTVLTDDVMLTKPQKEATEIQHDLAETLVSDTEHDALTKPAEEIESLEAAGIQEQNLAKILASDTDDDTVVLSAAGAQEHIEEHQVLSLINTCHFQAAFT